MVFFLHSHNTFATLKKLSYNCPVVKNVNRGGGGIYKDMKLFICPIFKFTYRSIDFVIMLYNTDQQEK